MLRSFSARIRPSNQVTLSRTNKNNPASCVFVDWFAWLDSQSRPTGGTRPCPLPIASPPTSRAEASPAFPYVGSSAHPQHAPDDDKACLSLSARRRCNQVHRYSKRLRRDLSHYFLSEYLRARHRLGSPVNQRAANSPRDGSAGVGPAGASICQT